MAEQAPAQGGLDAFEERHQREREDPRSHQREGEPKTPAERRGVAGRGRFRAPGRDHDGGGDRPDEERIRAERDAGASGGRGVASHRAAGCW